jgi:hypothetical protein
MAQQTAVSWLKDMLEWNYGDPQMLEITWENLDDLLERAKQMEKEQIVEAWNDGNFLGRNGNILADYSDGNRYYKKEFENK